MTFEVIEANAVYRISWYNDSKTILLCEILSTWTWQDAHCGIKQQYEAVMSVRHPVYTIFHYSPDTSWMPKGANGLSHIRELMELDPPNEKMVFHVGMNSMMRQFLNIATKAYGLRSILAKYRFPEDLNSALRVIAREQRARSL